MFAVEKEIDLGNNPSNILGDNNRSCVFDDNSRILKQNGCTIPYKAILRGNIHLHRPYIGVT